MGWSFREVVCILECVLVFFGGLFKFVDGVFRGFDLVVFGWGLKIFILNEFCFDCCRIYFIVRK